MACKIILGNRRSGKTTALYQEIFSILEKTDCRVYLVLPEQATFYHEKNIEEKREGRSLWNLEITSLRRLAEKHIFQQLLSPLGQHLTLYKMLLEHKDDFQSFRMKEITPGFVETLLKSLGEISMNDLSSEDIKQKAQDLREKEVPGDIMKKLDDMSLLLADLENEKNEALFNENQLLKSFGKEIAKSDAFKDSIFFFDDFFDFTSVEYGIIDGFMSLGIHMTFSFLYRENHEFFHKIDCGIQRISDIAANYNKNTKIQILPNQEKEDALGHLEKYYCHGEPQVYENEPKGISLFHSDSVMGEIQGIARHICNHREKGFSYKEMSICLRNLPAYLPTIKEIFPKYHIPFYVDDVTDLQNNPVFVYAAGFLRLGEEKASFASMFGLIKSGLFPLTQRECDDYENYCLAHGIKGKVFFQETPWTYVNRDEDLENVIKIRDKVRDFLLPHLEVLEKGKTPKDYATAIWGFLMDSNVATTITAWQRKEEEKGNFLKAEELEKAMEHLGELFDQIVLAFPLEPLELSSFSQVFFMGARVQKMRTIPLGVNEVEISVLGQSRPTSKKVVFLAGVNEGIYPNYSSVEGFFNRNDRELLGEDGNFWTRNKNFFYDNENILIYQGLTLSTEQLYLSYVNGISQDVDGSRQLPSIMIQIIKEMFPKMDDDLISRDFGLEDADELFWSADNVITALPKYFTEDQSNPWNTVASFLKGDENTAKNTALALSSISYDGKAVSLNEQMMNGYLKNDLFLNVSSLDVYQRCPFSYFAKYGLKLRERKELTFDAPNLGNFYHEALRALVEKMYEKKMPWSTLKENGPGLLDEILAKMIQDFEEKSLFSQERAAFICDLIKENLLLTIEIMARQIENGDGFHPLRWEAAFGPDDELKAQSFILDCGDKKVILTGQIDRVDIAEKGDNTYFRVMDYKSSDKDLGMDEIYYGIKLQLLIYMLIIENNGLKEVETPLKPGGMFYLSLKDVMIKEDAPMSPEQLEKEILKTKDLKGYVVGEEVSSCYPSDNKYSHLSDYDHDVLIAHLHGMIKNIGTEIFHGINTISPYRREQGHSCTFCSYHAVCGYEEKIHGKERHLYKIKKEDAFAKILNGLHKGGESQ